METVKLDVFGDIGSAIKAIEQYQKYLQTKADRLVSELSKVGLNVARAYFASAVYDGMNDVTVSLDDSRQARAVIRATGTTVLFIEFGTGVYYSSPTHPYASQYGFTRGSYGKGNGSKNTWGYFGVGGTNGHYVASTKKGELYTTHGNPANMSMYQTARVLESMIGAKAREVFG